MGMFTAFDLASSGIEVQKKRMDIAAENLANMSSTHSPEGGPYRKKEVVVSSVPTSFDQSLKTFLKTGDTQEAKVTNITRSEDPPRVVYDPSHPDADQNGNVAYPNISGLEEMIDMQTASKAYEANVTVFNAAKTMMLRTLDIGGV
jgi:flagellar basal-body rod protein FlgC